MVGHRTRNVMIGGRRTSIRLEVAFWEALEEILEREELTLNTLVSRIDTTRKSNKNLSGAIRVFIFGYFYSLAHHRVPSVPLEYESRVCN
ncbi:MAG: ribbon-helix-helix domain-containing protein [Inquilinus sp.]|uniref:ribbon-helix-helix domain-containing protein n=1 Tax=Inquilinus sp. TaxID=1932117 RepID=UPI003F2F21CF